MSDEIKIVSRVNEPENGCLAFVIDCNGERGTVRVRGRELYMDMDFWGHRDKIADAIRKLAAPMFTAND
jgi:hypothetical protein